MLTDAELVASARSGDRGALSEMYDGYADRLYDLCTSVLRDPDAAFDAMVDTFVLAALELYRLRRPDKLEPWLFALARQQLLGRDIPMGVDEHAEFDEAAGVATGDGAGAIVWEATSWLPGKDRVLLDLHARQPLDNQALADTLGVSPPHAAALVRDLDDKLDRQLSALLVARLARPDCERMKRLIQGEDEAHPDKWLRHVASHVDVCRTCSPLRAEQPKGIRLIAEVPAEPVPPEVRDEVLDRVDLLWSALGPPEWTAAVLGEPTPDLPDTTTGETTAAAAEEAPAAPREEQLDAPTGASAAAATDEAGEPNPPVEVAPAPPADEARAGHGGESEGASPELEYDAYDEVEGLVPPPPRLRRSGFPRSMYPKRRRLVRAAVIVLAGLFAAGIVINFRGFGRETRYFAAEAKAAAARQQPPPTTAPPTSAPPTTAAAGPDTRPPIVYNLATVLGCIGPRQATTSALASVVDPGDHLATVELVYVDPSSGETRRRMTATGGAFAAPIGPYTSDGTITWQVVSTDEAGNTSSAQGPSVAASSGC
ncbi:MAG TPA: sigma-70 family RNA polymerase sigma factor [Acidimicrobiia bacterium]|nr:sigma-70 family RNA polymerase sigma factor [Acidimicrobiia bacterium]